MRALLPALLLLAATAAAQAPRPLPHPVMPEPAFERALEAGTRSPDGRPGPSYWQNEVSYDMDAVIDPATRTLSGTSTVTYTNNSPDSLAFLVVKLRQNVHAPGVERTRPVLVTGGLTLTEFLVGGVAYEDASTGTASNGSYDNVAPEGAYVVNGTVMTVNLGDAALPPGGTLELGFAWSYPVPPAEGTYRQGTDGTTYYLGYWYPQMAVYDDVDGWHTDSYRGNGEHYMNVADYTYRITVPRDWLVWATGELQNEAEVLTPTTRLRLDRARTAEAVVHIVTEDERGTATQPGEAGELTWSWRADSVRDVAVSASPVYVWDAMSATVQRPDGPARVLAQALYPDGERSWERAAEYTAFSVEHLSETLSPYPYPHMTSVFGIISGGMEYPMMTLIGGDRTPQRLFGVTYHEISHMWFPMIVGSNEKRYTWMDEGLTSFNTNEGAEAFWDGSSEARPYIEPWQRSSQSHFLLAGTGLAVEPMRHNDLFPLRGGTAQVDRFGGSARVIASYSTPAVLLRSIEGVYGEALFREAYQEYIRRWTFKHPTPYDLFNTFEDVIGEDLDWLWWPTLFSTWTLDQGIASVVSTDDAVTVRVESLGLAPFPAPVVVTYADGTTARQTVPVQTWLSGETVATLRYAAGEVTRVEIDPAQMLPDVDLSNNVWPATAE